MKTLTSLLVGIALVAVLPACKTKTGGGSKDDDIGGATADAVGASGMHRLSRAEYDNTLRDLLQDESRSGFAKLPEDVSDPFDNDYLTQQPSAVLVEAAETLASEATDRLLADPARRDPVVGCVPAGISDPACLRSFVESFGRRALRRPLRPEEIDRYLAFEPYAVEGGDFYIAVGMVLRAMLQSPEFLYRIEMGAPVPHQEGLFRLTDWEVASRLSYFLWGSTPDDALLDAAEREELSSGSEIRAAAARLLSDPRARARVDRFHALWLGYHQLPHSAELTGSMRTETAALVERVVFDERRPWTDLFTSEETWVDARLAELYGIPAPAGGFDWTTYADPGRAGILSHGSFLSVAGKFGDTSPTQRGKLIRERLLCQVIPPPPPDVNVDEPPTSVTSPCKWDRYLEHRSSGSCAACHNQMDPVGFGLENYDQTGKWRAHDNGEPECTIAGDGLLFGAAPGGVPVSFNGPAALGRALVDSGALEPCLVTQVFRFAFGRRELPEDAQLLSALGASFSQTSLFDELLLELVSSKPFRLRKEES